MKIANYNLKIDSGWYFHLGDIIRFEYEQRPIWAVTKAGGGVGILEKILGENEWAPVSVPHDWCMSNPYDESAPSAHAYKKHYVGWYYNKFVLSDDKIENATLVLDGVLGQTTVYVNGDAIFAEGYFRYDAIKKLIAEFPRPSEIAEFTDEEMVLDKERIIERGNHEDLIEKKGKYYSLYTGAFELE